MKRAASKHPTAMKDPSGVSTHTALAIMSCLTWMISSVMYMAAETILIQIASLLLFLVAAIFFVGAFVVYQLCGLRSDLWRYSQAQGEAGLSPADPASVDVGQISGGHSIVPAMPPLKPDPSTPDRAYQFAPEMPDSPFRKAGRQQK